MKKILLSLITIGATASVAFGLSQAFFSDTETSTNNILQAGAIDLTINSENNPEAIVNITDLKPGDNQIVPKILNIDSNDAFVWMHIKDLVPSQGIQTEPEEVEENGTPKFDIQNFITYDLSVGEDILISLDDNIPLPDAVSCWIPLGQLPGATDIVVNQSFHFDPTVTNWAQGDQLTFTEEFYATQVRNNPSAQPPDTGTGRVWNPETKKCINCTPGLTYASSVVSSAQGLRKNGTAVLPERSTPADATGAPNGIGSPASGFFSLGFGGRITLMFLFPVENKPGDDLSIHEITNGAATFPEEKAKVEVSPDGISWFELTEKASSKKAEEGTGVTLLDFAESGFASIKFVRITDITDPNIHSATGDAFDLDAVDAKFGTCTNF